MSKDGLTFERNPSNPVLRARGAWSCGRAIDAEPFVDGERLLVYAAAPGAWDSSESGHPGVVGLRDGWTFLFFQGNPDEGKTWEVAAIELEWRSGRPVPK